LKPRQKNTYNKNNRDIIPAMVKLLTEMGLSGNAKLERLAGGKNNQVFKVMADDQRFCLKSYFAHEDDPRDRLDREFSFSRYAWNKGIRCIPQPLAADKKQQVALYEFIEGEKLYETDIGEDIIKQAIRFILELNRYKQSGEALDLPFASEACFSISEHLICVERRLKRLIDIVPDDSVDKKAVDFIKRQLIPAWMMFKKGILEKLGPSDVDIDDVIDDKSRCLSPSDFGFHNALRERNGNLRFIDFEYAGWDDPAKMICDFFCQPEVTVSNTFLSLFEDDVMPLFDKKDVIKKRVALLFPLYRIKWCCIMLNEFIPEGYARRSHAKEDAKPPRREEQLAKAKSYLSETLNCAQKKTARGIKWELC